MKNKIINIRAANVDSERETKYIDWYENIHVPMLLRSPEVQKVTRCKRIGDDENYPMYLSIYEFEDSKAAERYDSSPEVAESKAEIKKSWPEGGWEHKWRAQYEITRIWEK